LENYIGELEKFNIGIEPNMNSFPIQNIWKISKPENKIDLAGKMKNTLVV
jgi:hypothetical protein